MNPKFIIDDTRQTKPASKSGPCTFRILHLLVFFFVTGSLTAWAGTVVTLGSGSEVEGKLSLTATGIHIDSPSNPSDTVFTDILEANFGDDPLQTNSLFFTGDQLPPNWKTTDIGTVGAAGSATVVGGTFTISSVGASTKPNSGASDNLFFVGQTWTEDGVFTARLKEVDSPHPEACAGLMVRDGLDPSAAMSGVEVTSQSDVRFPFRVDTARPGWGLPTSLNLPLWLRLSRKDKTVRVSVSSDGKNWDIENELTLLSLSSPMVGLCIDSHWDNQPAKAVFDQISITPPPSSAEVLPEGVVLQSGSLLAGHFNHVSFDPSDADDHGDFDRNHKTLPIPRSMIAAIVMLPMERSRFNQLVLKPGILMRNGDTMEADLASITGSEVSVSSVLLGITNFRDNEVCACFIHPLQPQPAAFEVRLHDGSLINATAISGDATKAEITDASGLTIPVDPSEIAQIRAGTSYVQTLAQLDWKATAAPLAGASTGSAPAAALNQPLVHSWLGKNQEQIMETGTDTAIEFPLPEKFHALGVQIALSSESPANWTAIIHILADGREIAASPPFRPGDPLRFLEVSLQEPAHVTFRAESIYGGVKVIYVDPVALRD